MDQSQKQTNKTCPHCKSVNALGAKQCQSCGQPFAAEMNAATAQLTVRWTGSLVAMKPELRRATNLDQLFAHKTKIHIGRAPECDLVLAHPMVSRHHAELERTPDGKLHLTDLGSMN